ncbi:MAG TPA: ribosome biogenesis GTPase YlqF [bacterium]|nr:ribosome biogenesis GTPase YlqF [bacterium]
MSKRSSSRGQGAADAPQPTGTRPAVSWFPGHMHKAQRRLREEMQHIDAVLELRDARLPLTSGNPELLRIIGGRPRLLLLNKASLADAGLTRTWQAYFENLNVPTLALDADSRRGLNLISPPLRALTTQWAARYRRRGIRPPHLRLMVVGMPNVGKSTFINRLAHESRLKTAPMPGVTRGLTWVQLRNDWLLMDTPGVMLPRIDDEATAHRLGWIGALPDAALGMEALALSLLAWLIPRSGAALAAHYGLDEAPPADPSAWLDALCHQRGLLQSGAAPDLQRGAQALLTDFRAGRLGRFTLEAPPTTASPAT